MQTFLPFGGLADLERVVGYELSQRSEIFLYIGLLEIELSGERAEFLIRVGIPNLVKV